MTYAVGDLVEAKGREWSGKTFRVEHTDRSGLYVTDIATHQNYFFPRREVRSPSTGASVAPRSKAGDRARSICKGCGNVRARCTCLEDRLAQHLLAYGIVERDEDHHDADSYVREYEFAPDRKWRADFAWPEHRLLVEVEGGGRVGRHQNQGYAKDLEKYNYVSIAQWRLLRYDSGMVTSGRAAREIASVLGVETTQ